MAQVRVNLDRLDVLTRRGGMIDAEIERAALRVKSRAQVLCPVDRGRLRASITHSPATKPLTWQVSADTAYASWIHEGERFDPRAGRMVFVRVGPRPFLVDALEAARI